MIKAKLKMTRVRAALAFLVIPFISGCEKFLNERPDAKLAVPHSYADFQALMNYSAVLSESGPMEAEASADDFYLTDNDYSNLTHLSERLIYHWHPEIPFAEQRSGWTNNYIGIYYCNTVLEGVQSSVQLSEEEKKELMGQAYFYRGNALFDLAQVWCLAYDELTAANNLGLPLRMSTDFNEISERADLETTYGQILADVKQAAAYLPINSSSKWRPSKTAAYGLLARINLAMGNYIEAHRYADLCLGQYSVLLDFNTDIDPGVNYPFPLNNAEVIYNRTFNASGPIAFSRAKIVDSVYNLYSDQDIRKAAFFRSNTDSSYRFKGTYRGTALLFSGISTNEIFLTRAESAARMGDVKAALIDLNTLLEKRMKSGTFRPITAKNGEEATQLILLERRKELIMRGLRWMDIKRLNRDGAGINLERTINGQVYYLPANDLRFALPLPEETITMSNMNQNPR